ncbi:unnamed protein product [Urochloa decumbens]|uniref:Uncharacterized protein n=1 Tax=Urochloa decumbens TaxID=240449 RepID=A0ABC9C180_9POAL
MAALIPAFSTESTSASPAVLMLRRSGVSCPSLPGDSAAITILLPSSVLPSDVPLAATPAPNMVSRRPPKSGVSPPAAVPTFLLFCTLFCIFMSPSLLLADCSLSIARLFVFS